MSRFGEHDTPLGKCDRCQRTFLHKELRADSNKKSLLVCETCWDALDPFVALVPYQKNLDVNLSVKNARPLQKVGIQTGYIITEYGQVIETEDGQDGLGTEPLA